MRRPKQEESGSLDSLLDTMTNVVGILIIILVVTQLGVADAIKRLLMAKRNLSASIQEVDNVKIEKAKLDTVKLEDAVKQLKADMAFISGMSELDELNKIDEEVEKLQGELEKPVKKIDPSTLEKDLKARRKERDELAKKLKALEDRLADIKARLARMPKPGKAPPPKIVNLPDPRPAQKGAKPEYFLCREGKIYHANLDMARKQGAAAVGTVRLRVNSKKQIDPKPLINYFKTRQLGDRQFWFKLEIRNFIAKIQLERKKDAGEDTQRLVEKDSYFRSVLKLIKARKLNRYIRFVVWPDSFETYLAARNVCDSYRMSAGWEPTGRRDDFLIDFPRRLECIGRKAPKPSSKPPEEMAKPPKKDPIRRNPID